MSRERLAMLGAILVAACGSGAPAAGGDGGGGVDARAPLEAGSHDRSAPRDVGAPDRTATTEADAYSGARDAPPVVEGSTPTPDGSGDAAPCTTTITYGQAWIHGSNHPAQFDVVSGVVTWDGTCTTDGSNSSATLSNGWQPYFTGTSGCIMALDESPACGAAAACATRVSYGTAWLPPANHPASYDDITGRVFSDGNCYAENSDSYANLSNGWQPTFSGSNACALSFRYTDCGGLYANPVIPTDCPDPGVLAYQGRYYLSCTSGDDASAFPIYTSTDLATWTQVGYIFPSGHWPTWAGSDFWAPEIHVVGGAFVAYFAARDTDGMLSVGVASASSPLGPFTDIGMPLVHDEQMGHIDPTEFTATDGTPYVIWKDDGNAIGQPTPIHAQQAAADGLSLVGTEVTLITDDQTWEGGITEGPWMVENGGTYFLFYSGNAYDTASYAIGVASAPSPLGPFTKAQGPILVTGGAWAGPGHCSVIDTFAGDTYMVYHSWEASAVGGGPGRLVLTDAVSWGADYPSVPLSPSSTTRPMP